MKHSLYILLSLSCLTHVFGQGIEVEGNSIIRGILTIHDQTDSSSVIIGNNVALNLDSAQAGKNIIYGSDAANILAGSNNVILGHAVGLQIEDGDRNTAIGNNIITDTNTNDNILIGAGIGTVGSLADENIIIGNFSALNATGTRNTVVGHFGGSNNELGDDNTLFGYRAGRSTEGGSNAFFGLDAGLNNAAGFDNTFIGTKAGLDNSTGKNNTFVGLRAGDANKTGDEITCIGEGSDVLFDNLNNATAIGQGAIVTTSNAVRIGNTDVNLIQGEVAFTSTSDARLKENISPLTLGLAFINTLRPAIYHRINNVNEDLEMGLIAQELQAALDKAGLRKSGMIQENADGIMSVRYNDLIAPIIKSIQELTTKNQQLNDTNQKLKKEIDRLSDLMQAKIN